MKIKQFLLGGKSKNGNYIYRKMLNSLNNPKRNKYNNPERLVCASGIQHGQTVLEIGCGSGFFTVSVSKVLGNEGKLYSIDIHPIAVEETQKIASQLGLKNVIVQKDDATKLSFKDSMFDLVLVYGVVPSPVISMKDMSREIYRVLKPDGICAIWTISPLWTPRSVLKYASFDKATKTNGVFCLRKS